MAVAALNGAPDSADWYRVAPLHPRLREHVLINRHRYRGHDWYVIRDPISGRHHRVDADSYRLIAHFDGENSVEAIWEKFRERLADEAPTRAEIVRVLEQLGAADLIQTDRAQDFDALIDREESRLQRQRRQRFANPLLVRFPLFDPDNLLRRILPLAAPCFTRAFAVLWCLLLLWMGWQVVANWSQLLAAVDENLTSPFNLILLVALYPLVKGAHEIAHGLVARRFGCEVHEMGIALLLFVPLPYVDVSSVNSLSSKYQRMLVSVAGIVVELSFAGLGLWLWLNAEVGLVKDIGLNLLLIGGISSLLFNGNPLLKYDGYYVLADFVEIPSLYERATRYWQYALKRYVLRVRDIDSNVVASGERGWFLVYGLVSVVYRLLLMWTIALYVAGRFFIVGVVLAIFLALRTVAMPLIQALQYLLASPQLAGRRSFASLAVLLAVLVIAVVMSVPLPSYTLAQGVVWLPEDAQIRTRVSGFAGPLLVTPNTQVKRGTTLMVLSDPLLDTRVQVVEAKLSEQRIRYRAAMGGRYTDAENVRSAIVALEQERQKLQQERESMAVVAPDDGVIAIANATDIEGQFFERGELIGFVVGETVNTARVVVPQSAIGRIEAGVAAVQLRLSSAMTRVLPAEVARQTPEAIDALPSPALAARNGGSIRTRRNDDGEDAPVSEVFQFDLRFDPEGTMSHMGERVHVRFQHADESMFVQFRRRLRQTFLRQFDV